MFIHFVPLMFLICLGICFAAEPLTNLFFHNPAEPVYLMTLWGFRIMPFFMPFGIIVLHFVCYAQAINKQFMVNLLSLLDGVVYMCVLSLLLIEAYGINGIYMAVVLNSVAACITILFYSCIVNRKIPHNMDELMMIPDYLGVKEEERLDLSVQTINDVVKISQMVQDFCLNLGIDEKRSYLAGLSLEEMAGNVVGHGYTKDKKKHAIDVRVVYISDEDDVVLRIKDDCKPFNPEERSRIIDKNDLSINIGLRMVYKIAEDVQYQYLLGLNVLTIRI
jgi:anti-sigma regulatory factor (Ser/Thr protein kinase)